MSTPLWIRRAGLVSATLLAGLALLTFGLEALDADRRVSGAFYAWDRGFLLSDHPLVMFAYDHGQKPLVVAALAGLLALPVSLWSSRLRSWRRPCAYVLLCALVGPWLVVNAGFKDNWGRPRPDRVEEFGGEYEYRAAYDRGPAGLGKSFPSGHAAAGFYWTLLYFLLRERRPRLALLGAGVGLAAGALLGTCRVLQGRHFMVDVLWSAALITCVNLLVYRAMMPLWRSDADDH